MPAMTMPDADPPRGGLSRKLPFLLLMLAAVAGAFALRPEQTFAALADHHHALLSFRDTHYFWSLVAFVLAYVAIVAFSLPGATVATLAGGFLFGVFPGVFLNVAGATVGAVVIFLAARAGFGAAIAARLQASGGAAARLMAGLRENEWSVLMVMRLVPAVPFFLANLIPAFAGVRADRFAITTFFGIMPATLVFTSVGSGLGDVFASGQTPDLSVIFAPHVLFPILGLAALSALPILVKLLRKV